MSADKRRKWHREMMQLREVWSRPTYGLPVGCSGFGPITKELLALENAGLITRERRRVEKWPSKKITTFKPK